MFGSIGRLVRAFAEIEDLINLFISRLANISESKTIVLLGRTPISRKLEIAMYLATMAGPNSVTLHKFIFDSSFLECQKCRNAVAHGILLGKTEDNRFAFLTAETLEPTGSSAIQTVISFKKKDIAVYARHAEQAVPQIEKLLQLSPLREKRLQQPLEPHRKGLRQQQQKKKQKRARRS
jgi:hypothetical protein